MEDGFGSAMLRSPELIADLVKSVRSAIPRWRYPIGVANMDTQEEVETDASGDKSADSTNQGKIPFSVSVKIRLVPTENRATGGESPNQTVIWNCFRV